MIDKTESKTDDLPFLKIIEKVLLASLLIILPFFLGLSSNTGIMLWQLIAFLLVNLKLLRSIFIEKKILRPGIYDILIFSAAILAILHFIFSANTYNSYIIATNLFILACFVIFYLRYLSKKELLQAGAFFITGVFIQIIISIVQLISNPSEPVRGGFLDPNYFSIYLIIGALLILGCCLFDVCPRSLKMTGYLITILIFSLIIATQSRSATGLFVISASFLLFLKRARYVLIGIAVLILLIAFPNPYKSKIQEVHKTDPYAYSRLNIYRMDIEIFADYFLLGTGLGCFADYSPVYNFPVENVPGRYRVIPEQAHNSYLQWVIETGISGLIIILMLLSTVIAKIYFNLFKSKKIPLPGRTFNPGVDVALLSMMAVGLIHNVLQNNALFLIFIFMIQYSDVYASEISKQKKQYIKISLEGRQKEQKWYYCIWLIAFLTIWYFSIHASWLSTVYLDRGVEKLKQRRFTEAISDFDKSERIIPFYSKALLYEADINAFLFSKTANFDYGFAALSAYDKGLESSERNGDLQINRIKLLIMFNDLIREKNPKMNLPDIDKEIETSFSELFRTHPKKVFYYHDYAVYQWRKGNINGARDMLEFALNLEPNYITAHLLLGIVYKTTGDIQASEDHIQHAREIAKKYNYTDYKNDFYLYNLLKWDES